MIRNLGDSENRSEEGTDSPPTKKRNTRTDEKAPSSPTEKQDKEEISKEKAANQFLEQFADFCEKLQNAQEAIGYVAAAHIAMFCLDMYNCQPLMSGVVEGKFTNKRNTHGQIRIRPESLPALLDNLHTFYDISKKLRIECLKRLPSDISKSTFRLYRAIALGKAKTTQTDWLPSSTSFNLDFVKNWSANRGGKDQYAILEITVPLTHSVLVMAYPDEYTGPRPIEGRNQNQQEVTLAPARYVDPTVRTDQDGFQIVAVTAQELEEGEVANAIKGQVNNPEKATAEDLGECFRIFKQFYSLDNLRQKYTLKQRAEEVHGKELTAIERDSGLVKTLSITLGTGATRVLGKLDILLEYSENIPQIRLSITSDKEDGTKAQVREWKFDLASILDVDGFLRSLELQQDERFESLGAPGTWFYKDK